MYDFHSGKCKVILGGLKETWEFIELLNNSISVTKKSSSVPSEFEGGIFIPLSGYLDDEHVGQLFSEEVGGVVNVDFIPKGLELSDLEKARNKLTSKYENLVSSLIKSYTEMNEVISKSIRILKQYDEDIIEGNIDSIGYERIRIEVKRLIEEGEFKRGVLRGVGRGEVVWAEGVWK
ncbi:hypothetical protein TL16_g10827 [Triparma laevis f. inornata]|uniref:Uncharacterized protein n=1 Tax=Triparma laevis f. inornata TaxID=1714386 RepID=A0A9W7BAL6_9STRA|nr:hypothetical protein TL16_g10827 [Triparma laevis f. inornata]